MSGILPAHVNLDFMKTALEAGLRLSNILVRSISYEDLTIGGENYCSDIYRGCVKFEIPDEAMEELEERSLIIKCLPLNKQFGLKKLSIYNKEVIFYLDIKPKLEALMWFKKEPWILAAQHFYSTAQPIQTIVFDDLCKQRFELKSRQIGLDLPHAKLVLQKMAEYHALSMLMIEKEPELILERFPYGLLNLDSIKSASFKALFGAQLLKLAALAAEFKEFERISTKLLQYYDNFTEQVLKSVYPLLGHINVLNHGDLWVNNLFFRYGSTEDPVELRFIDFQLCFCGSPGFDINYFLHTSVQLPVLRDQRETLIEVYYNSLLDTLRNIPYTKSLPTYEQLLDEVRQREAYGFFVAFAFFPLMSMVSMDSQDNSLENLQDPEFARKKIELMFCSNTRTMQTLKYVLKRANDLGILN